MYRVRLISSILLAATSVAISSAATSSESVETAKPLPEPLSLDYVLQQIDLSNHYSVMQSQALRFYTQGRAELADARYATEAALNLRAQWVDPSAQSFDTSSADHKASLNVSKRLYDFGVTSNIDESNRAMIQASEMENAYMLKLHTIAVTRRYFDVLLADLEFAWWNEAMSMDFVTLDKARDMFALKQLDEIDMLQRESDYQASLVTRSTAEVKQRTTRVLLAEALGLPGQLSVDLEIPELPDLQSPLTEPEELIALSSKQDVRIKAAQQRVEASKLKFVANDNQWLPSLTAELEVAEYQRELPSRERWRAGLNLKIPLHETGMHKADAAVAHAEYLQAVAELNEQRSRLREDVYKVWQNITMLIAKSKALQTAMHHADRALDKSRGEYELELRTDFGEALVRTSRIRFEKASNDYALAIEKMRLALMLGEDPRGIILSDNDVPGGKR